MKNKHLSYEERMYIEQSLNKGLSVHRIALKLSRPDSSIVREIQRNRYNSDNEHRSYIPCVFKRTELCTARRICGDMDCLRECSYCTIANGCGPKCSEYKPQECAKLNKSPFVCNGCSGCDERKVRSRKYIYSAGRAQVEYERNLKESRSGISISQQDMKTIDDIVSPLLLKGQSIRVIYMTHKDEIPCSESALYRYIDKGFLSAKNIDLPRRVRFKLGRNTRQEVISHGNIF